MKFLNQFQEFDFSRFATGKVFLVVGKRPWLDYDTGAALGTTVECVIYKDETIYKRKEGDTSSNLFEKLSFKVSKPVEVPLRAQVKPVNPKATIWGEFRNQLSVKAEDIEVVPQRQQASSRGV